MSVCFTARCAATPAGIVARRAPPRFADRSLVTTPSTSYAHHQKRRGAVAAAAGQGTEAVAAALPQLDASLDDRLSQRPLELDPAGYFIIKVDAEAKELVADFYTNFINEQGLACDPVTGKVISCKNGGVRLPARSWRGRSAKDLSVTILETDHGFQPCTHLEHANYLGRELQRAEFALLAGAAYVQD
ncbi:uncharacterized conserved UCP037673 [Micractinium conductrix]|uniref:Uncharacterized conserved UCP037673 n=1 Tax=Micractinium conductrix TaxID=554055 RepID=A0A2P6VCX9_9CHLO|nr:uncharacterized conserved UCP037673 [Micractinium conductrix]|eukprot:PSC71945.1 uncharacterized conserved UCP037673 [Micractinium conductrix]